MRRRVVSARTVAGARQLIAESLEAEREGRPPPEFRMTDEVWGLLDALGELDEWERAERRIREAAGERDTADVCDIEIERWYDYLEYLQHVAEAEIDPEFLLGVPEPSWAYNRRARGVVFVSARRLSRIKREFQDFDVEVCIDSGGFTELHKFGEWRTEPEEYVELVRRVSRAGVVRWAAIQDWMCEPSALRSTGLTIREHRRTVDSYLRLRELAPEIRWLPVIQGQQLADYLEHLEIYERSGVYLRRIERVGVGSICRRTSVAELKEIIGELHGRGLRLHAFGLKSEGLRRLAHLVRSSDSMSWSLRGRFITATTGERAARGVALSNSQIYAEEWRVTMQRVASEGAARNPLAETALNRALESMTIPPGVTREQFERIVSENQRLFGKIAERQARAIASMSA